MMAELTYKAQFYEITRHTALSILNASMSRNTVEYGKAVWRWVRRRLRLVDEPFEYIQRPEYLLGELAAGRFPFVNFISGDCDDGATLAAILIFALGIPVQFVAVKASGAPAYQHVFCEMLAGGQWFAVDPTVVNIPGGNFDYLIVEV